MDLQSTHDWTAWREFIIEESKPEVHSTPRQHGTIIRYKNRRFLFLYHFIGSARAILLSLGSAACSFVVPNAMSSDGMSARRSRMWSGSACGQMNQTMSKGLMRRLSGLFVY